MLMCTTKMTSIKNPVMSNTCRSGVFKLFLSEFHFIEPRCVARPEKRKFLSFLNLKVFSFLDIKFIQAIAQPILRCKSFVVLFIFAFT